MPVDIEIYCDGACSGNPGPGGWAAVLIKDGAIDTISGFEPQTTNNRMELQAALEALSKVGDDELYHNKIAVYTDSTYLKQGITEWISNWKKNNWRKGTIKNQDLWQQLDQVSAKTGANWFWVRAHSGNYYNEMADKLARGEITKNLSSGASKRI